MSLRLPKRPRVRDDPPSYSTAYSADGVVSKPIHTDQSASSGWQLAVASHLNSLTPEQAKDFKTPASLEECLDIITQAAARTSRFSNLLQLFRPVITPLKRFEGTLDVIVQVNSGIASPIWGPLKAAITVASDHFKTLESLAMVIYRILGSIERYSNYEKLFAEDKGVQSAIGDLYGDLIDFCSRIVRFHSKHFRSVFVSFDHEFGLVSELISFHSTQVDLAANAAHMVQSREAHQASMSMQELQERAAIYKELSPVDVENDLTRCFSISTPGSCDYAFTSAWLADLWRSEKQFSHCLIGPPGYGKTILSACLIEYLQSHDKSPMYFFCKADDPEREQIIHALRTILSQLCSSDEAACTVIRSSYRSHGRLSLGSVGYVSNLLKEAAEASLNQYLFVVIDALDESKNATALVDALMQSFGSKLRLLATSRDVGMTPGQEANVLSLFSSQTRLSIRATSEPVHQYIQNRMQSLPHLMQANNAESLVSGLVEAADGLWLAARLLMDEVARATSMKSVIRLIANGPAALASVYDGILKNREANMLEDEIRLAGQALLWLDLDDYMSVYVGVGTDLLPLKTLSFVLQSANDGEPVFGLVNLVTRVCCPLVEIDSKPFAGTVDFVHLSALQQVQHAHLRNPLNLPRILRPQRLRQLHRARAAVWYFGECAEFEEILTLFKRSAGSSRDASSTAMHFMSAQYFQFAYGLWSLLKLPNLPNDLDEYEIDEVDRLLRHVISFLTSSKCMRWCSYALILNIIGSWVAILGQNVIEALAAIRDLDESTQHPTWIAFNVVRRYFLENYLSILYSTASWDGTTCKELKDRYAKICGRDSVPAQYRCPGDGLLKDTPLDAMNDEAACWQKRMRRGKKLRDFMPEMKITLDWEEETAKTRSRDNGNQDMKQSAV